MNSFSTQQLIDLSDCLNESRQHGLPVVFLVIIGIPSLVTRSSTFGRTKEVRLSNEVYLLQGEVMAFDRQTKMLSIKNPSTVKPGTFDVNLINMNMVSAVKVMKEATESPPPLANLNYAKLMTRATTALNDKHRAVMAVGVGVTPVAQKLYNTIAKTIDEIKWGGKEAKEICIMSQVPL